MPSFLLRPSTRGLRRVSFVVSWAFPFSLSQWFVCLLKGPLTHLTPVSQRKGLENPRPGGAAWSPAGPQRGFGREGRTPGLATRCWSPLGLQSLLTICLSLSLCVPGRVPLTSSLGRGVGSKNVFCVGLNMPGLCFISLASHNGEASCWAHPCRLGWREGSEAWQVPPGQWGWGRGQELPSM